jgi:hypothetical protein
VDAVVTQALDVVAVEAYPGLHEQSTGWAPFPAQLEPAPHARHAPVFPAHALAMIAVEAYPGAHVHGIGVLAPPPHATPAPHTTHAAAVPEQFELLPAGA